MRPLLALLCCIFSITAHSGDILSLDVIHDKGRYTVDMEVIIHAPLAGVRRVMTDYDHLTLLNPAIKQSEVISHTDAHHHRVRIVSQGCVLFFCIDMLRTEEIEQQANGDIVGTILPAESDFNAGKSRWQFEAVDRHTRVTYHAEIEPAFWIPPLIGPWIIKNRLHKEALITIQGIEQHAHP